MIGLLIVTHCDLGREFLNAAEFIVGSIDAADTIPITQTADSEKILKMIEEKVKSLNKGQGVLILTDMFGGTPSNLSLSFLKEEMVDVLTGVNLPMLIKFISLQRSFDLKNVAKKVVEQGRKNIHLASALLKSKN